ncbi:DHA2 family efflux MFS transporter permease subunit [Lapillicoccus jejuensis]|uniref:DHA2 family lincomycin resistance protein-like MFS transporter n=1 Tax=Lapillicoccus jejuensis TaxID=402171 RepID=A0A542E5X7_9MICO|nr:DHA2 family efflux MFS transporter permease subunit [Lapillicoccus jejuensis]TQJ10676.1 DHA2 family lincomycin resistance protein-like MFS transporter [Lapillicoccus jejuensis]
MAAHPTPTTAEPVSPARVRSILSILVAATFVVILNETIMVNAIPRLMAHFAVSARDAQWLSTAFMLSMAVVIPVTGWFLQRVRTRTVFTLAMGLFLAGTALATAAWAFPVLLLARVVQASGTAVMLPLLMTTLMTIVAPQHRGKVMGNVTLAMAVAPALGPAVSGLILQLGSWRLVFAVTLPVAAAMLVVGLRLLVDVGEPRVSRIDALSVAQTALGFGAFVYGLSQLGADGSDAGVVPPGVAVAVGLVALGLFGWRQVSLQRRGGPLLDLRTLRYRAFTVPLVVMCVSFMAMMGAMITLPLYLQNVHGYGVLQTGLMMMPGGVAMGVLGPAVGSLFDRYGARPLVVPGSVALLVALIGLSRVDAQTPAWWVVGLHVVMSLGLAFLFTPLFTVGLSALPSSLYSHGSAVLGTLQQVAAAIGTAVVVTVLSARSASLAAAGASPVDALGGGVQWGFAVGAAVSVLVVALAVVVPARPLGGAHGGGPAEPAAPVEPVALQDAPA